MCLRPYTSQKQLLFQVSRVGMGSLYVRGNLVAQAVVRGPHLKLFPPTHPGVVMDVLMLQYDARPSLPRDLRIRPNLAVPKEILSASVM